MIVARNSFASCGNPPTPELVMGKLLNRSSYDGAMMLLTSVPIVAEKSMWTLAHAYKPRSNFSPKLRPRPPGQATRLFSNTPVTGRGATMMSNPKVTWPNLRNRTSWSEFLLKLR